MFNYEKQIATQQYRRCVYRDDKSEEFLFHQWVHFEAEDIHAVVEDANGFIRLYHYSNIQFIDREDKENENKQGGINE